jgi:ABC-type transporter Mla subunit MlaD
MASEQHIGHTEQLANGLEALLAPLVADSDAQVEAVLASQQNLSASLDRLVAELERVSSRTPDSAGAHAAKLAALRGRVAALSSALHGIQERLNRLNAAVGRLPATTLADLARQELHAPPPPSPHDLAARAGHLTADLPLA